MYNDNQRICCEDSNTCVLFVASSHQISDSEKVKIVIVRLSSEYDTVVTLASFTKPLPLRQLIDILLEFEMRQQHLVVETLYYTNLAESVPPSVPMMADTYRSI